MLFDCAGPAPPEYGLSVLLLLLAALGSMRAVESADDPAVPLNIGVRSSVDERWHGIHKDGAIEHGKLYGIASIKEAPSANRLTKPVDEARLATLLRAALKARGFVEMTALQKPDVVLTILSGRGFLRNPYLRGAMLDEDSESAPVATINLPDQIFRQREAGYEAKIQDAQQEKLFLLITAWKFPDAPQEKPAEQWKTTMVVDDPNHRDLNQVTKEMLAAGADYFDRQIKDEEVRVNAREPQGSVILGPLKIIESEPSGK